MVHLWIALSRPLQTIRRFIQTFAAFLDKTPASLVAGRTKGTFDFAKNSFATDISLSVMISVNAEVVSTVEGVLVISVTEPMLLTSLEMVGGSL